MADSTSEPSACDRAVELSAPLVTPVKSHPDIPVKEITSLANGVFLPVLSCLLITNRPGACNPTVEFSVIVVTESLIAPLSEVDQKLEVGAFSSVAIL